MEQSETFRASSSAPEEAARAEMPLCRVLLVEDDFDDQVLARKRLGRSGRVHEVVCFQNGTELIQYLYDQGFHDRSLWLTVPMVIVLDLNMPQMNGFEACRRLREADETKHIPIIMVTTRGEAASMEQGFSTGCNDYVTKPVNSVELLAKVRNLLAE